MKIAEPTIERLVQYHRLLGQIAAGGRRVISSREIGEMLSFKASQVRKDLSYFGEIGKRGVGYHVDRLYRHIGQILASPRKRSIGLVGVGKLGEALLGYRAFRSDKFHIKALFDVDPSKIGTTIQGIPCYSMEEAPEVIRENDIEVIILAVPGEAAQEAAGQIARAGTVRGILSFSPASLVLPEHILVYRVDISVELEKLLFFLKQQEK